MSDSQTTKTNGKQSKWGVNEKTAWYKKQVIRRSYLEEVVMKINALTDRYEIEQYGALSYAPDKYPLYLIKSKQWDHNNKTILVTGGVHGYETSGVHGALGFLETEGLEFSKTFNIIVAPCVSPWGYETINRWNPNAIDPNRSFYKDSPAEESSLLMNAIHSLLEPLNSNDSDARIYAHIDLHETTDTDNTEFMPALAARDATELVLWDIPDGFYTVGDSEKPVPEFQAAIIQSVKTVTHIAPSDKHGNIIGETCAQEGVINYQKKKLGLCAAFTDSEYCTTTEVYPDSPNATPEDCIKAQVAAVKGGLNYLRDL